MAKSSSWEVLEKSGSCFAQVSAQCLLQSKILASNYQLFLGKHRDPPPFQDTY